MNRGTWGGLALLAAACQDPTFNSVVEDRLTITQGVYGQTLFIQAGDTHRALPLVDLVATLTSDGSVMRTVQSQAEGFFQLQLDPAGDYTLCTVQSNECAPVTVVANKKTRIDYETGMGTGWQEPRDPF